MKRVEEKRSKETKREKQRGLEAMGQSGEGRGEHVDTSQGVKSQG